MPTPNKLVLDFKDVSIPPDEPGLKFVVFSLQEPKSNPVYDFGFCNWDGHEWGEMSQGDMIVKVVKWAVLPNATNLLF